MALVNYRDEYTRLRKVALYRPRIDEIDQHDPQAAMYIAAPNPSRVYDEFDGIVAKLGSLGIEVIVLESSSEMAATTNMIYLRDVAFVFRDKIVLANMKHPLRQIEPKKFRDLMIKKEPGYKSTFIELGDTATMEGADIFAINDSLMYAYTGSRTTPNIADMLETNFENTQVKIINANIHGIPQHILGGVHILDDVLASRRIQYCTDPIENYEYIDFEENPEISNGFALNIVTLGPREVLMPENNPTTKAALEARGVVCHEVAINEIHKMGGGLACMVLPLVRES